LGAVKIILYGHEGANFTPKIKSNDEEEQQLIERMKATVGAAVSKMEPHIQAGTICCPSAEENIVKTPKQKKTTRRYSSTSPIRQAVLTTEKTVCCAGDYCWKKDHPRNFTAACSMCKLLCHEYYSKICELIKDKLC
jgi:hypothetical protein